MNLFRYYLKLVIYWYKVTVSSHANNMFLAKEKWSPRGILFFDCGTSSKVHRQTQVICRLVLSMRRKLEDRKTSNVHIALNHVHATIVTVEKQSITYCEGVFVAFFALEHAIRRVQVSQNGLKLSGTHQLLVYADQWLTQEFFFWGGGSTNSVEDRGERERGSGDGSPLVRGFGGSCHLVQEISFLIVTFF